MILYVENSEDSTKQTKQKQKNLIRTNKGIQHRSLILIWISTLLHIQIHPTLHPFMSKEDQLGDDGITLFFGTFTMHTV